VRATKVKAAITSLGHFGLDIRLGATRVVCDPWLSPRGAYIGGRHQFPDNSCVEAARLHDTPTLFISSPRPDHLDVETLRDFPKNVRVILPELPSRALSDRVRALGFDDVVELPDWQWYDLGEGARLQVIASSTKHVLGSTMVLDVGGEVVVDQSDCLLDEAARARLAALKPRAHFVQFSGASYDPAIYDLPPEQLKSRVDQAVSLISARFVADAIEVGAQYVVPSGGPACFLEESSFELNFGGSIFFDADELAERVARQEPAVAERLRFLYPGDVAGGEGATWEFNAHKPYDDKRHYLGTYRDARAPVMERHLAELRAEAEPVDGKNLRSYLRDLFQFEDMTWDIGMLIQLHLVDGPDTWIDFRKKPYRYLSECEEKASYVLTLDSAWMSLVLKEKITWNDLLMSRRVTIHREPDRDCPHLMSHFEVRHDPALFDLVRRLNPALITVQDEQMEYVCQRFCPHRGRDLEYAMIERGVLTCTAHGWRFDLRKGGRCLWGGDTPLVVKEMRPLKP
jgi:nitrite reductase/ring-hydroxylating ferredoxin subunit